MLPFLPFLPAIMISAGFLNRGSGIFATFLSTALAVYFFVPPTHSFGVETADNMISVAVFFGTSIFIAIITEALHLAYTELEQSHAETQVAHKVAWEAHAAEEDARRRAEAAAHERDLLLAEFGHRVKNDLARIAATVRMGINGSSPETAAALRAVADRIAVLARVHDRLSQNEGHLLVDMHEFLHDLTADLRETTFALKPVGLFVDAEHHGIEVARVGAVGLITNELVTNAVKHAFPDDRGGAVHVRFWREGIDFVLVVADDGVGLPDMLPCEVQKRAGMGRRLTRALAAQLGGHIETTLTHKGGGTTHLLRFPVDPPGPSAGKSDAPMVLAAPADQAASATQ